MLMGTKCDLKILTFDQNGKFALFLKYVKYIQIIKTAKETVLGVWSAEQNCRFRILIFTKRNTVLSENEIAKTRNSG